MNLRTQAEKLKKEAAKIKGFELETMEPWSGDELRILIDCMDKSVPLPTDLKRKYGKVQQTGNDRHLQAAFSYLTETELRKAASLEDN